MFPLDLKVFLSSLLLSIGLLAGGVTQERYLDGAINIIKLNDKPIAVFTGMPQFSQENGLTCGAVIKSITAW